MITMITHSSDWQLILPTEIWQTHSAGLRFQLIVWLFQVSQELPCVTEGARLASHGPCWSTFCRRDGDRGCCVGKTQARHPRAGLHFQLSVWGEPHNENLPRSG